MYAMLIGVLSICEAAYPNIFQVHLKPVHLVGTRGSLWMSCTNGDMRTSLVCVQLSWHDSVLRVIFDK